MIMVTMTSASGHWSPESPVTGSRLGSLLSPDKLLYFWNKMLICRFETLNLLLRCKVHCPILNVVRCYKTSFSSGLCRPVQFRNWTSSARYSIKERRHCSLRLAAEGKWSFCKIVKLRSFCCGHFPFEAAAAQGPATRHHCTVRCGTFLFKFF